MIGDRVGARLDPYMLARYPIRREVSRGERWQDLIELEDKININVNMAKPA